MPEAESYKSFLKERLLERRAQFGNRFTFQSMASACRVQKTYLSRVFNGDAHLSDDQLFLACEFLGLDEAGSDLVTTLHQLERTTVSKKKKVLSERLGMLRAQADRPESALQAERLLTSGGDLTEYHLNPHMQLVHMFLTIPEYRLDPNTIAQSIGLSLDELRRILTKLQGLGFVSYSAKGYEVVKEQFHLASDSPLQRAYASLVRLKGVEKVQRLDPGSAYNFSVIFTADEDTKKRIQERFAAFLREMEAEVRPAPSKQVFQMTFDLFSWSS